MGLSACFATTYRSTTEISSTCVTSDGEDIGVLVSFAECLSSSCDTLEAADCELSVEGNVVTVTGEAEIKSTTRTGPRGGCTSDCGFVDAVCSMSLPPGDYVLRAEGRPDVAFSHPGAMDEGECITAF